MSNIKYIFIFGSILILLTACKKTIPMNNSSVPTTFSEVFEQYWNMMNKNYVFWDIDPTNWDQVYTSYKPLFENLNLNNTNDVKKSVSYFKALSSSLIDQHYYIEFTRSGIIDSAVTSARVSPLTHFRVSYYNKLDTVRFPYKSYWNMDTLKYFTKGKYFYGEDRSTGDYLKVLFSIINDKILYFSFNQFVIRQVYTGAPNSSARKVIDSFLYYVKNLPSNISAIIIDVRENGGGAVYDLSFLLGRFRSTPYQIGYTKYKSNNGRLDFTPLVPAYITPPPNSNSNINVPIYVLADAYSYSCAELTAISISSLTNGYFIGEQTGGATGPYGDFDDPTWNDGPFEITNFMKITTSSGQYRNMEKKPFEGTGVTPDIPVDQNSVSFRIAMEQGKDLILEKAISLVK